VLSQFFIHRPNFAMAISLLIVLVGALSYAGLPREQYPNISPPTVTVSCRSKKPLTVFPMHSTCSPGAPPTGNTR